MGKPGAGIILCLSKSAKGPPGLTYAFDGLFALNTTYAFASYALRRDLEFSPAIFGTETSD